MLVPPQRSAAAKLVDEGYLVRLWNRPVAPGDTRIVGLYRADSETELDGPLAMATSVPAPMAMPTSARANAGESSRQAWCWPPRTRGLLSA
jgi:hypothetical protein